MQHQADEMIEHGNITRVGGSFGECKIHIVISDWGRDAALGLSQQSQRRPTRFSSRAQL